jgi:hypothetical protein
VVGDTPVTRRDEMINCPHCGEWYSAARVHVCGWRVTAGGGEYEFSGISEAAERVALRELAEPGPGPEAGVSDPAEGLLILLDSEGEMVDSQPAGVVTRTTEGGWKIEVTTDRTVRLRMAGGGGYTSAVELWGRRGERYFRVDYQIYLGPLDILVCVPGWGVG